MTYHVCVNVLVNPVSALFSETKIQKIVSHSASHGMTAHDNGKASIFFVHSFDSFHGLGQISIPRFGAHGWQSPATKKQKSIRQILFSIVPILPQHPININHLLVGHRIQILSANISHFFFQKLNGICPNDGSWFSNLVIDEPFACFELEIKRNC